jgi:O-antigen/teichoic acid export membrane protein
MGIIIRQSIKQSVINYLGVLVGAINLLFIYPKCLEKEDIGLINFLISTSLLVMPFAFLGTNQLTIRFFPMFKEKEKGHQGFLFLLLASAALGLGLSFLLFYLFKADIWTYYAQKDAKYTAYLHLIPPLIVFQVYATLLTDYTSNFQRIAFPAIFNELVVKIGQPLLAIAYFWDWISLTTMLYSIISLYGLVTIGLLGYLIVLREWHWRPNFAFITPSLRKNLLYFAALGMATNVGGKLMGELGVVMIGTLKNLGDTGIYAIAFFIASVIDTPRRAITRIAAPIIAKAFYENDMPHIEKLYKQTSVNQLIVGVLLFLLIWLNIDSLYEIIPKGEVYQKGKQVVLLLGMAKLIDMGTSLNNEIFGFSKYVVSAIVLLLITGFFNVIINWYLVQKIGIEGAAWATLLSILIFNIAKMAFIYYKFDMQPFSMATLKILGSALAIYMVVSALPSFQNPFISIFFKGCLTVFLFGSAVIFGHFSEEVDGLLSRIVGKFISR